MFFIDMPNALPQETLVVAQTSIGRSKVSDLYGTAGICKVTFERNDAIVQEDRGKSFYYALTPGSDAIQVFYLKNPTLADVLKGNAVGKAGSDLTHGGPDYRMFDDNKVAVKLAEPPLHGTLSEDNHSYYPDVGYTGNDKFVFLAEIEGYKVKLVYYVKVLDSGVYDKIHNNLNAAAELLRKNCPNDTEWLISATPNNGLANLESAIQSKRGTESANISVAVSNLPNGAIGSTEGTTITLDNTAAGHGWFIDYTPYLNEEFLPTSNPYEWQARPGSAADGKMDMLTVLWHEYGHALGLEHTAAGHDLMSTTLTPGVRRLPTPEELAVLNPPQSPFVKGGGEGGSPGMPLAPLAGLPLLFTRQRKPTSDVVEGCGEERTASIAQYAVAANPTLTNGDFTQADGSGSPTSWQTQGDVIAASATAPGVALDGLLPAPSTSSIRGLVPPASMQSTLTQGSGCVRVFTV